MGAIFFFVILNSTFYLLCNVLGLYRPFLNLDYIIILFLIYYRHQKLAVIFFLILYTVELLLLVRQIFPFFKIEDILYILKFILLSSKNYQIYFLVVIGFALFSAYFLYKIKSKQQPFIYFFIAIAGVFILQNLYFEKKKHYIESQLIKFIEIRFDGFVQSFNLPQKTLKKIQPTAVTSALYKHPVEYSLAQKNILFIISESLGAPKNKAVLQHLLQPLQRVQQISDLQVEQVSYLMPTMYAEFRELCAMQLESFNLKLVQNSFSDCLPNKYKEQNYSTTAIHAALGIMYDRKDWYPKIGFDHVLFYEHKDWTRRCYSFSGGCDIELGANIAALLQQQKQFVYWLTLNSHAPYDPRDIQKDLFPCEQFKIAAQSEVCRNFKIHAQFFEALADVLSQPNIKPTHVIIVGDHSPTIFNLQDKEKYLQGEDVLSIRFNVK